MSEPKRFNFSATIVHHIDGETSAAIKYHTEPNGLFVSYEDYTRLKAEVERLTKAGDNMYSWLGVCGRHNNSTGDDWLRAKKGLPSLTEQWEIEKRNRAAEDAAKEGHNMWGVVAPYVVPPCIDSYTAKEGKQP